jgi:hypothetical protein
MAEFRDVMATQMSLIKSYAEAQFAGDVAAARIARQRILVSDRSAAARRWLPR